MDLSFLPLELIEEVAKYLNVDDIVSCSMVNRQWRRVFDNDRIWNRYYTFHKKYFEKEVTKGRNSLKYFFGSSKSKKHILRELQVRKNLVQGKYELTRVKIGRLYCDNLLDVVDDDGNHLLFISCSLVSDFFISCHRIEVWNMNDDEPVKLESKETPIVAIARILNSQMKIFQNKLYYIILNNYCLVFEFCHPEYKLTLLFEVICPVFWEFVGYTAMVCKPNMVLGFIYSSLHFQQSAQPWVHVWGNDSSLLYKNYSNNDVDQMQAQRMAEHGAVRPRSVLVASDGGSSDNVLLISTSVSDGLPVMTVLLFSSKTFKYTTLFVRRNVRYIYCELVNEVVVLFYYQLDGQVEELYLLDNAVPKLTCCTTDRNLIYEPELRTRRRIPHHNILTANEGKEVLILDSYGDVTVFDVFKKKEISAFRIRDGRGENVGTFIKDNFIFVQEQSKKKTALTVWDFKRGKRLYELDHLPFGSHHIGVYRFSFINSFRSPPKIFAIREPGSSYACRYCDGEIVTISFL